MKANTKILALASATLLALPAAADIPADGAGLSGIYAGSYLCEDGEHGVVLDITTSPIEGRSELRLNGTLGIVPVLAGADGAFGDVAGSFTISGIVTTEARGSRSAGYMQFQKDEWVVEPDGYGAANFAGQLTQRTDGLWQITGTPLAGPTSEFCSDMIATRFLP